MRNTSNIQGCSALCFSTIVLTTLFRISATASDTITATQPLTEGQTLVSAGEVFELGFFSPNNSSNNTYLAIWYKKISNQTIVWIANRNDPITNSPAVLKIGGDGNIALIDAASNPIWSSNQTNSTNTVAQILDSGNFVLRRENDVDSQNYLWQSFDYPTDTLLPGMKMGWDAKKGLNRYLLSSKSRFDPSASDYSFRLDIHGFPEIYLWDKQNIKYRSGPWNGQEFSGVPEMNTSDVLTFSFVIEPTEVTYSFELDKNSPYSRLLVNPSGVLQRYTWIESTQEWNLFWYAPEDQCDTYMECGVYGICDTDSSPVCQCFNGFEPENPTAWNLRDGSDGCVRVSKLECGSDGFLGLKDMKLPDTSTAFVNSTMSLAQCEAACKSNCSCTAYANMDVRGSGSGCVMWVGDLLDMRQYSAGQGGQDLFVRVAASDLEDAGSNGSQNSSNKSKETPKIIGITVAAGVLLLGLSLCFLWKRKRIQRARNENRDPRAPNERSQDILLNRGIIISNRDYSGENTTDDLELPLYDFGTIAKATSNFSRGNKLGQGGFGCVYKAMLVEGQEVAVKRLSKNSGQGTEEFKNEVKLIARLQHRNLVRLLGCCVEMEEKILIYEYMENKSLDSILFNKEKCSLLNWPRRFNVICGIARGLLYLHQDSRFRIIHRDLKASNILLDRDMNPKISDFGMARIFGGDQTEGNTKRVVGTYGYMAPEYAMDGLFSVKSDVFSFGVLIVEIISGKKNRGFYNANQELNLLGHAWRLWREGKGIELLDPSAGDSYPLGEVMRCLHVGLLCVQEQAEDRPNMSSVVLMLGSESASMSQPKNPGFCLGRRSNEIDSASNKQDESGTVNQVTVTILDGR